MCLNATGLYGTEDKLYDQKASTMTITSTVVIWPYSSRALFTTLVYATDMAKKAIKVSPGGLPDLEIRLLWYCIE